MNGSVPVPLVCTVVTVVPSAETTSISTECVAVCWFASVPVISIVCTPSGVSAGIVTVCENEPSSPVVAVPSATGVECNVRSTVEFGCQPPSVTVTEPPGATSPVLTCGGPSVVVVVEPSPLIVVVVTGGMVTVVVVVGASVVVVVVAASVVVVVGATVVVVVVVGPTVVVVVVGDSVVVVVVGATTLVVVVPPTVVVVVVGAAVVVVVVGGSVVVVGGGAIVVVEVGGASVVVVVGSGNVVDVLVLVELVLVVVRIDSIHGAGTVVVDVEVVVAVASGCTSAAFFTVVVVVGLMVVVVVAGHVGFAVVVGPPFPTSVAEMPFFCGLPCGTAHVVAASPRLTVAVVSISVRYDVTVASALGAVTVITTSGVVNVPLWEPEIGSGPGVDNTAVFVPCESEPGFDWGVVPSFGFHDAVAPGVAVSMSVIVTLPLLLSNS